MMTQRALPPSMTFALLAVTRDLGPLFALDPLFVLAFFAPGEPFTTHATRNPDPAELGH